MCGILGYLLTNAESCIEPSIFKNRLLNSSKLLRHRGPDWNGIYISDDCKVGLAHERLSIVDINTGHHPLYSPDKSIVLICNGEVYNHVSIRNKFTYNYQTNSDCEVIIPLYIKYGKECVNYLYGIYCFILYDINNNMVFIGRDRLGVNPLYYGVSEDNDGWWFASELKAITNECSNDAVILDFPPGNIWYYNLNNKIREFNDNLIQYYNPNWFSRNINNLNYIELSEKETCSLIRDTLINSVRKRLMCDVPYGVLLSGGLDSSLIASITNRYNKNIINNVWGAKLHTFSIGLKGSPDLKYAKNVAKYLDTIHHECNFTIEEGLNAIKDVIFHTETYDITTVRASTPMYLMSRIIKAHGIKMVLSGEGSDELFGGYLYFHSAPNEREFHKECVNKVKDLHKFDCLRANKSTMAWGVEVRVPFLDSSFVDSVMNINPTYKFCEKNPSTGNNRIEKYILRKAFQEGNWLPNDVLWRQKEQFGDGVGYSWIDNLKSLSEDIITDIDMNSAEESYPYNTPETKEAYYYRKIYEELFPNREKTVKEWIPQIKWGNVNKDPSGRVQSAHDKDFEMNLNTDFEINNIAPPPEPIIREVKKITLKSKKIKKKTPSISSQIQTQSNETNTQERCIKLLV